MMLRIDDIIQSQLDEEIQARRHFSNFALESKEFTLKETEWMINTVFESDLDDCINHGFEKLRIFWKHKVIRVIDLKQVL